MNRKNTRFRSTSLMVIGLVTFILAGSSIAGLELPDLLIRILGILDILAVSVLVYTSKKRKGSL